MGLINILISIFSELPIVIFAFLIFIVLPIILEAIYILGYKTNL